MSTIVFTCIYKFLNLNKMKIEKYLFSPILIKKKIKKINKNNSIHYTGMQSERESIKRLCNPNLK